MIVQENAPRNERNRWKVVNVQEDSERQIHSVFIKVGDKSGKSEQVLECLSNKLDVLCATEVDGKTV